jgi:lipid-A-disaccharide synthase
MMVRKLVKVKYAHLANIMADRAIVPEFIQENCVPEKMAEAAYALYQSPQAQRTAFADIKFRLGFGQEKTPSQKAAAFVLSFLR